jgi:hypothetical protein
MGVGTHDIRTVLNDLGVQQEFRKGADGAPRPAAKKSFTCAGAGSAALVHGRHEAHTHRTTAWLSQTRRAMKWVLFTMLLCAVGPTQASAQNEISQQLLELDQDQRNAAFTHMLWDSNRKCDQVIRTAFSGTLLGVDDWEVLCRDRRSYSISVLVELELHDTIITSLSCRELLATSKRLLHKAGSNRQATGCKIR